MARNMFQTFDLGRSVRGGQEITYNRLRNEALSDEGELRREAMNNRKRAQEIEKMYDEMPAQIEALETEGLFDQANELRDQYIKTRKTEVEILDGLRKGVNKDNYKALRQDLIQSGAIAPEMMPTEYSDDWWRKEVKDKRGNLSKFTLNSWRDGAIMSRDLVTQDGQVRWDLSGEWYADPDNKEKKGGKGTGANFEFKAADANQIGEQIERLFGGFYDPQTGKLKGLDASEAARVQAIQEEAERIYSENNGFIPHGVAVTRAARNLGINIKNYRDSAATDPLSLRE